MLFGVGIHSKGDLDIAHLIFTQKSKCGGNRIASRFKFQPSKGVSLFQDGVSLGLLKKIIEVKKKEKKGERYKKRKREKKK